MLLDLLISISMVLLLFLFLLWWVVNRIYKNRMRDEGDLDRLNGEVVFNCIRCGGSITSLEYFDCAGLCSRCRQEDDIEEIP